ncbi:MAG: FAD-dependent oxidoreductase, partial [Candidatus Thermoplasmatota archaeon]|nr:FAD-dependent oxidoreductase [Candidatus Thermoplasmatota archaeon]
MAKKIGVFICHCGENIASKVDVEELSTYAKTLDDVVVSKTYKYICSEAGAKLIKDIIKKHNLTGVVTASCSPRMHEQTFRKIVQDAGLNPFNLEIANIREQCSWIHDDNKIATEKAKKILRGSVAKARLLESLVPPKVNIKPEAMVIGGGISGIQTALDIAESGYKVFLVEKTPSIGGRMAQLDKTFPTLDCSGCILTPKMKEVFDHPNIELLSYAEVTNVEGTIGNYLVTVKKKARYVDFDRCKGCGDCAEACRLHNLVESEFDEGIGKRSAIYIPFSQAVPPKYTIDRDTCLMLTKGKCGSGPLCVESCPEKCIDFNQKDVEVEIEVGVIV